MGLLDALFPTYCVCCKTFGEYLCANCFAKISFETVPLCIVCNNPSLNSLTHPTCKTPLAIDGVFCAVLYRNAIKKLLYAFKYKPYVSNLENYIANLFVESLIQQESFSAILQNFRPICIPIPLSKSKEQKRGYNQSFLLAKILSQKFKLPYSNSLNRIKETKPQFGLNREERHVNMQGAFDIKIKPKFNHAFLLDDVLTTGSTIKEAAKVLKRNGVEKVWGICFAQDQ